MRRTWAILLLATLIPACGGDGGGGSGFSPVVVFSADKVTNGQRELFAADASGMTILLSGLTPPGAEVEAHSASPDGAAVAFLSDRDGDGDEELYVVPSSGGTPVEVSGADGRIRAFYWSPDSTRLAYQAQTSATSFEVFVASATSPRVKINGPLPVGGSVLPFQFQWSPTSERLSYGAAQTVAGVYEIWTALPDGTGLVKVSGTHGGSGARGGLWSPDGSRVAYVADGQLWTAPGGSAASNISVSGAGLGSVDTDYGLLWSPDGTRIAYVADHLVADVYELFTADGDTAASAVKVSGTMVTGGDVHGPGPIVIEGPQVVPVQWMPDGDFILYLADQDVNDQVELYAADPDGGGDSRISRPMGAAGQVTRFAIAPDSQWAAYLADETGGGTYELLSIQRGAGMNVDLVSGPLVTGGDVLDFRWHPEQAVLLYLADQEVNDHAELYRVLPDTTAASVKVSGPLIAGGTVDQFQWAPDGSAIFYRADQDVNEVFEVFRSNPDGSGNLRLSGPLVPGGDAGFFNILP